jgi:hypothetical protein
VAFYIFGYLSPSAKSLIGDDWTSTTMSVYRRNAGWKRKGSERIYPWAKGFWSRNMYSFRSSNSECKLATGSLNKLWEPLFLFLTHAREQVRKIYVGVHSHDDQIPSEEPLWFRMRR